MVITGQGWELLVSRQGVQQDDDDMTASGIPSYLTGLTIA